MVGIYKINLKSNPKKFYIIGSANIEAYVSTLTGNYVYTLIWPCTKFDLKRYEEHFREKLKSDDIPVKEEVKPPEPEAEQAMETAVMPELEAEHAILTSPKTVKKTIKRVRKKKK